jgi:hypothetical protein
VTGFDRFAGDWIVFVITKACDTHLIADIFSRASLIGKAIERASRY